MSFRAEDLEAESTDQALETQDLARQVESLRKRQEIWKEATLLLIDTQKTVTSTGTEIALDLAGQRLESTGKELLDAQEQKLALLNEVESNLTLIETSVQK